MRVFVAGGSGVLGRRLVPQLVARGHAVTASTTSAAKLGTIGFDGRGGRGDGRGRTAPPSARPWRPPSPDAIIHQMTAINPAHAGKPDLKHPDRWFAGTNRLRTEGTDHLLAAAEARA